MPRKEPPSNPPESAPKKAKTKTPKASKDVVSLAAVKARQSPKPSDALMEQVQQSAPAEAIPLPQRWEQAVDALAPKAGKKSAPSTDELLETLALTIALDAQGGLAKASLRHKDALRRVGSATLLRMGPGLEEEFAGLSLAREGLRRLTLRAEAPRSEVTVPISDADLQVYRQGTADGFRLAEIALRVERSLEARRILAILDQLETPVVVPSLLGGLRLAAETSNASIRDPAEGRRVAELTLGDHAVELYRFADGVLAAYSVPTVTVRLGGVGITRRQGRLGYAEALIGPEGDRVELEVESERVTLELGIPSTSQFPPRM